MESVAQLAGLGFFVVLLVLAGVVAGVSALLNWLEDQEGLLDEYSDLPCAASAISSAKAVGAHDGLSPRNLTPGSPQFVNSTPAASRAANA